MFEEEGSFAVHFMPCGGGCHHLTQIDLADSRKGFARHVEHLMRCSGLRGQGFRTPEQAHQDALSSGLMDEYGARKRFETKCRDTKGWNPVWHGPHTFTRDGREATCYGLGSSRAVPALPHEYYTKTRES